MNGELLPYYERELLFIRKMASEFAGRYPERAAALKLTHNGCEDPHVERMIEAFALIAGRIQRKIDDEFPEITQALLDVLYPHFLRQVPAMAIAQFEVDPEQSKSPPVNWFRAMLTLFRSRWVGCNAVSAQRTRLDSGPSVLPRRVSPVR